MKTFLGEVFRRTCSALQGRCRTPSQRGHPCHHRVTGAGVAAGTSSVCASQQGEDSSVWTTLTRLAAVVGTLRWDSRQPASPGSTA